jgi:hypothetical protein
LSVTRANAQHFVAGKSVSTHQVGVRERAFPDHCFSAILAVQGCPKCMADLEQRAVRAVSFLLILTRENHMIAKYMAAGLAGSAMLASVAFA